MAPQKECPRYKMFTGISNFVRMSVSGGVPQRSLKIGLLVGTILNLINSGPLLFQGIIPPLWKMGLTYIVPYLVSTYGAVSALTASRKSKDVAAAVMAAVVTVENDENTKLAKSKSMDVIIDIGDLDRLMTFNPTYAWKMESKSPPLPPPEKPTWVTSPVVAYALGVNPIQ